MSTSGLGLAVGLLVRLLLVLLLGFLLFWMVPGDPVRELTRGRATTPEQVALLRQELHLDRPLVAQFVAYLGEVAHGDLGRSLRYRRPVSAVILERLGPTVLLAGSATVVSALVGSWSGFRAGWAPGGRFDRWSTATALAFWATPSFWLGLVLLVVLGAGVGPVPGLFPTGGMRSPDAGTGAVATVVDVGAHLVLPGLTLVAVQFGQYHLLIRSSLLTERDGAYLKLARAKGLRESLVRRHALPNVVLPTLTQAVVNLGFMVSGVIAVESVYSWPGLGYLTFEALQVKDLPLLHGTFLVFSASVVMANSVARWGHARVDPRSPAGPPRRAG